MQLKTGKAVSLTQKEKGQLSRACNLKEDSKCVSLVAHMLPEFNMKLYASTTQMEETLEMFVLVIFKRNSFFLLPQPLHPVIPKFT